MTRPSHATGATVRGRRMGITDVRKYFSLNAEALPCHRLERAERCEIAAQKRCCCLVSSLFALEAKASSGTCFTTASLASGLAEDSGFQPLGCPTGFTQALLGTPREVTKIRKARPPPVSEGALQQPKAIFFNYEALLDPRRSTKEIAHERAKFVRGFLKSWKLESGHVSYHLLSHMPIERMIDRLEEADLEDLFDEVLTMEVTMTEKKIGQKPETGLKIKHRGEFLAEWLRYSGMQGWNVLDIGDKPSDTENVMTGGVPEGEEPRPALCHTFRTAYLQGGVSQEDVDLIKERFLERSFRGPADLMHAHSFHVDGIYVLDGKDSPLKCTLDSSRKDLRKQLFEQSQQHSLHSLHPWVAERPDLIREAGGHDCRCSPICI